MPEAQAFKDREPQRCGMGGGELLNELLQRQPICGIAIGCLALWGSQLIEQARLATGAKWPNGQLPTS